MDVLIALGDELTAAERGIAAAWNDSAVEIESSSSSDSSLAKADILPNEPFGDGVPNISDGGRNVSTDPKDDQLRPRT